MDIFERFRVHSKYTETATLLIAITTALVAFILYWPAIGNDFVHWDDSGYVFENPMLFQPWAKFWGWAFTSFTMSNWHPLTWLSLKFDIALFGPGPKGFHVTNVFLHGFNTALVVLVGDHLVRQRMPSAERIVFGTTLGLLFAVHPLHVESVAWISERKDVLYAVFYLLALLTWLRYTDCDPEKQRRYYVLCLLSFICSLLSKPMAVTFPILLLLLDVYPLNRLRDNTNWFREKLPFFLLALASALVTLLAQHRGGAVADFESLPFIDRLLNAVRSVGFYLYKWVWPNELSALYPLRPLQEFRWLEYIAACLFLAGAVIMSAVIWRRSRLPAIILTIYLCLLMPVLGLIQVGSQAAADRYMYIPIIVPSIILSLLVSRTWSRVTTRGRWIITGIVFAVILALSIRTTDQIRIWNNTETLLSHVIELTPEVEIAHYNLGNYYQEIGDLIRAEAAWVRVLELAPDHSMTHNQIGSVALLRGDLAMAASHYRQAIESDPKNAEALYNFAMVLEKTSNTAEAAAYYQRFLDIASDEYSTAITGARRSLQLIESQSAQ